GSLPRADAGALGPERGGHRLRPPFHAFAARAADLPRRAAALPRRDRRPGKQDRTAGGDGRGATATRAHPLGGGTLRVPGGIRTALGTDAGAGLGRGGAAGGDRPDRAIAAAGTRSPRGVGGRGGSVSPAWRHAGPS